MLLLAAVASAAAAAAATATGNLDVLLTVAGSSTADIGASTGGTTSVSTGTSSPGIGSYTSCIHTCYFQVIWSGLLTPATSTLVATESAASTTPTLFTAIISHICIYGACLLPPVGSSSSSAAGTGASPGGTHSTPASSSAGIDPHLPRRLRLFDVLVCSLFETRNLTAFRKLRHLFLTCHKHALQRAKTNYTRTHRHTHVATTGTTAAAAGGGGGGGCRSFDCQS